MIVAMNQHHRMTLGELFPAEAPGSAVSRPVSDLSVDSRRVVEGGLFMACAGSSAHGLDHLDDALAAGACQVAWEPAPGVHAPTVPAGVVAFPVAGLRSRIGLLADQFFGEPSRHLAVYGCTGTNGKTSVTHLLAGALGALGTRAGVIGTVGAGLYGALRPGALTTPDPVELHRLLADVRAAGGRAVAMEVSSHALDQGRVAGVRFDVALFTNISRDHLDYHGSEQAYAEAKARLFRVPGLSAVVINTDDAFGGELVGRLTRSGAAEVVAVGRVGEPPATVRSVQVKITDTRRGLGLDLVSVEGSTVLRSPLIGAFNADNLGLAFAALTASGHAPAAAAIALGQVHAPPGRMELFHGADDAPRVVVDYAHTPDALAKALEACRAHCAGRLWCVFGCGGERDTGKRPEMGRIAADLADAVIVTDDNPRGEDGDRIVADILAGIPSGRAEVERDRERAIRAAIDGASADDLVLVAGKGHEDYQLTATGRRHFSDRETVARLLGAGA